MKIKHNKKRNTAFLYESLIKEITKAVLRNDKKTRSQALKIIKENFKKGSILRKELDLYNTLLESKNLNKDFAKRLMLEAKKDYDSLDRKQVFNQQTQLIRSINETFSKEVFANFISNYRDMASVGQFFQSTEAGPKKRLLIEDNVLRVITSKEKIEESQVKHVDKLTYKTFVNKFNSTYKETLKEEQKQLLTNFIVSFSDNGLGLKSFMNEELGRLKKEMKSLIESDRVSKSHKGRGQQVLSKLDSFSNVPITEQMVQDVFYIQDLVGEISKNG